MKSLLPALCLLALAGSAQADVTVNFRNNVLPNLPTRLVRFGAIHGALSGTPVVNGVPAGSTYVAQLMLVEAGTYTPIGNPAPFRSVPQSDGLAGTWSGANRTIPGLPPDAVVNLAVVIWDSSDPEGGIEGVSATFSYQNALSSPPATTDTYMINFQGFEIATSIPEPSAYALTALTLAGVLFWRWRK